MSCPAIQKGQDIAVRAVGETGALEHLRCDDVTQRNWSRIARAESEQDGKTYFVKQYVDKTGVGHSNHWTYEKDGVLLAAQALDGVARVPALVYRDETLLLNVFEYTEIVSIDVLLRTDPSAFNRCFKSVVSRMAETLVAMQAAGQSLTGTRIATKSRAYGGPSNALNFKGFEIRNSGVPPEAPAELHAADLVLFDFVRPYLAPIEEAAAKLFVSIGLLNWGNPVSRFVKGPDYQLMEIAYPMLEQWLDKRAIAAELDLQERFRMAELKSGGGLEKVLKHAGMILLGRKYLSQLRSWCDDNIAIVAGDHHAQFTGLNR